jgi:hypothetical protein
MEIFRIAARRVNSAFRNVPMELEAGKITSGTLG